MAADPPDRRRVLKLATCAAGGGIGAATLGPIARFLGDPAGRVTVTSPTTPLDVGDAGLVRVGGPPVRVDVVAPLVRDGWSSAQQVVLGAAWLRRTGPETVEALSAVCPHLGCAVAWDGEHQRYVCPCHKSLFGPDGGLLEGESPRGLDPLPIEVKGGRLQLTWQRFRIGASTRELA
jgi:menaquinol-cytochrome c reductase iron-sulfur subunit